jgi:hypothetical protein
LHKRKLGGLGDRQNDPKYGWPQNTKTNDNIIKCEICCTVMADTFNMNKESIHKVLSNDLDTRKMATMCWHFTKKLRVEICIDLVG